MKNFLQEESIFAARARHANPGSASAREIHLLRGTSFHQNSRLRRKQSLHCAPALVGLRVMIDLV
jgi:hypothetical protein